MICSNAPGIAQTWPTGAPVMSTATYCSAASGSHVAALSVRTASRSTGSGVVAVFSGLLGVLLGLLHGARIRGQRGGLGLRLDVPGQRRLGLVVGVTRRLTTGLGTTRALGLLLEQGTTGTGQSAHQGVSKHWESLAASKNRGAGSPGERQRP
ncbi:hypothetical protein [Streptomyces justiciae]|uniref:hypothetical protein n=1 Tax=Streptomyces justiciae TaxID=2780140 RepID=UPI002ADD5C3F|nr:hypothetical protein [Streptomyces justiciae]